MKPHIANLLWSEQALNAALAGKGVPSVRRTPEMDHRYPGKIVFVSDPCSPGCGDSAHRSGEAYGKCHVYALGFEELRAISTSYVRRILR